MSGSNNPQDVSCRHRDADGCPDCPRQRRDGGIMDGWDGDWVGGWWVVRLAIQSSLKQNQGWMRASGELVAASRGQTTQLAGMGGFGLKIHSMDGSLIILTLVAPPNIRAFSRPAKLQHLLMMTTVRSEAIAAAACVWTGPTDHRPFSFLGLPNTVMPFSLNSVHKCENHRCDALPSDPSCCWGYL